MIIIQLTETRYLNLANVVSVTFSADGTACSVTTTATDGRYGSATLPTPHTLILHGDEAHTLRAALRRLSGVSS